MSLTKTEKTVDRSQLSDASDDKDSSGCWRVERTFVPFKIHYFLLNGAHVGVVPYLPVYAKSSLGCSATTVGLLATCMQFSATVSKPLFGMIADYLNRMKILIGILLVLEILVNMLMLVLPPIIEVGMVRTSSTSRYSDEPEKNIENRNSIKFLRYAAPIFRGYDVSVGLHLQSRSEMNDSYQRLAHLNQSAKGVNITSRGESSGITFTVHDDGNHILSKRHANYIPTSERTYKCHMNCGSLIPDAVCYQPFGYCIDPQTVNVLSCSAIRVNKKDPMTQCKGFLSDTRNFTLAYRMKTLYSQWDSRVADKLEILPDSFVYYRGSRGRSVKKQACNMSTPHCNLKCESGTKFCAKDIDESYLYRTYQFWTFCMLALVSAMCQGALYTLSDTACYEKLRGSKSDFGRQRLWAAVGWGAIAPLTGYLNDMATENSFHENYSSGWYIMALLSLAFLVNLCSMDFPSARKSESMFRDVRRIMVRRHFILMEVNVFFMGVLNAYATNYVIWYMEMLGSSRVQMGLALAVDCLFGEAPFMYASGWLISKLGHWHIVTLTFAAFGARFGAYYLISDPWMVLPIELLHGITFGLIYTTITSYGEEVSAAGTGATIQGILGGTYQGLGSGVGCLVAGLSFDRYGGRVSFLLVAIFSACLALCHSAVLLICKPYGKEKDHETLKDVP